MQDAQKINFLIHNVFVMSLYKVKKNNQRRLNNITPIEIFD